ncbi:MAG: divalent metal cation transporter [Proteobacteria bacterium]|nr:divalent metal cation transporter [Pseudomonadota bacterium]
MKRLLPILLWSAISAAFVGPGTVTTAAAAGAGYGFDLLWALVFSTVACLALQEATGRLTAISGLSLGEAMQLHFGRRIPWLAVGAVVLGCFAYEAGNILGAVAGANLCLSLPKYALTLATGIIAMLLLCSGSPERVARILGVVVALMGVAFFVSAVDLHPEIGSVLKGSFIPKTPAGSGSLLLGLIGTTVVPYNLFLGSGLARGQSLRDIRIGLGVAIPLGGLISISILITGTAIEGEFSYGALSDALGTQMGPLAAIFFAFGLFCAGLSSAVTAPLAAAFSVRSLAQRNSPGHWADRSRRFKGISMIVLAVGLGFGMTDVKPIPAIIAAQALNGIILPFVAIFLLIATNDRKLMGDRGLNGLLANTVIGIACLTTLLLGASSLIRAIFSAIDAEVPGQEVVVAAAGISALILAVPVVRQIFRRRSVNN